MANILDRYGIKEVADVTFYKIGEDGNPSYPVLYLDTLKVSTIEQTAETADARGGKGNPKLISWDYGKEITVTLEDALFSAKSLAIMFGNGTVADLSSDQTAYSGDSAIQGKQILMRTEKFTATKNTDSATPETALTAGWTSEYVDPNGKKHTKLNPKFYPADEAETGDGEFKFGHAYFCTYDLEVKGQVIEISADTFPGTYYVTGDTYARSEVTGEDEFFQFIIPKAKVTAENTITLEAEGDPSVFNMNLTVLRPADGGPMMKLVKYDLVGGTTSDVVIGGIPHNHDLASGL